MTLTYTIEETAPYSRAAVASCVAKACDAWSKALSGRVRFQPLHQEDEDTPDIVFRMGRIANEEWVAHHGREGETSIITFRESFRSGKTYSWAVTGWQRFWGLKDADLLTYALHEIGHALGLPHHIPDGMGVMERRPVTRRTRPTHADVLAVLPYLATRR